MGILTVLVQKTIEIHGIFVTPALWNFYGTCAAEHHANVFLQIDNVSPVLYLQSTALQFIFTFYGLYFSCSPFQAYPKAVNVKRLLLFNRNYVASLY